MPTSFPSGSEWISIEPPHAAGPKLRHLPRCSSPADSYHQDMDSPVIANILRQLSCRRAHGCTQASSSPSRRLLVSDIQRPQRRSFLGLGGPDGFRTQDAEWQQRSEFLPQFQKDRSEEYRRYPMVTADQLRRRKEPPKRVKMLVRDFIEGVPLPPDLRWCRR